MGRAAPRGPACSPQVQDRKEGRVGGPSALSLTQPLPPLHAPHVTFTSSLLLAGSHFRRFPSDSESVYPRADGEQVLLCAPRPPSS